MGGLFSGGLGKIAAPLANTGLDPVGKATNKALGIDSSKQQNAAAAATTPATGAGTDSSSVSTSDQLLGYTGAGTDTNKNEKLKPVTTSSMLG